MERGWEVWECGTLITKRTDKKKEGEATFHVSIRVNAMHSFVFQSDVMTFTLNVFHLSLFSHFSILLIYFYESIEVSKRWGNF